MYVLLVEDHQDLALSVCEYLEGLGWIMDVAGDGITGLHLATIHDYDVIALDLGLPGIDGLELCRKLRREARKPTPLLMLTARDTIDDKVEGFDSGADDYLVKPVELRELEVRLKALVRRSRLQQDPRQLRVADLTYDLDTLEISRAGRQLSLTRAQMQLLRLLMMRSPSVVTRSELERELWGDEPAESDTTLRSHIHGVRTQIDPPRANPLLKTVHGIGYRLAES